MVSKLSKNIVQMGSFMRVIVIYFTIILLLTGLSACEKPEPLTTARYEAPDQLFERIERNVHGAENLEQIQEIDHARLGDQAGSTMPPARVLIFSNRELETVLIQKNPLTALDLPLRVLAYESAPNGESKVVFNSFEYLRSRYHLGELVTVEADYNASFARALQGISEEQIASFSSDQMDPDGIITLSSPFDFAKTLERVHAAIQSQDDTVGFGQVDFRARSLELGIIHAPSTLILFGGPAPGAKAMAKSPTLGLDAFCQKFLVWEDDNGQVYLSFNDLLALAERQNAKKLPALRVINYRLNSVFEDALLLD